jgi:hypothetical protein
MFDSPLSLQKELKRSHLIQRLQKPSSGIGISKDNPFSFGGGLINGGLSKDDMNLLRSIWSFDYMGSAEFEWGAVPNALSFLAEQSSKNNLVAFKIIFNKDKIVYYVCPIPYEEEVRRRISQLYRMDKKIDLKEHCGLKEYFDKKNVESDGYARRNLGWLELDNGFAFFVDKNMFEKFCKFIGINM